jgi:putative sigma-54 modulation protein
MQINVTFRHTESSPALREYAEEKISRIKKYLEEPIDAHVVLKVEKFRHIVEVTINADGQRINGMEKTDDMYSSIDKVADKIESQVKKYKDKIRSRKAPNTDKAFPMEAVERLEVAYPAEGDQEERQIIRTEQLYAKPMDIDEAVLQLNMSNGEFMVFTNRDTSSLNVLYRRKDGHYGLIEPM